MIQPLCFPGMAAVHKIFGLTDIDKLSNLVENKEMQSIYLERKRKYDEN